MHFNVCVCVFDLQQLVLIFRSSSNIDITLYHQWHEKCCEFNQRTTCQNKRVGAKICIDFKPSELGVRLPCNERFVFLCVLCVCSQFDLLHTILKMHFKKILFWLLVRYCIECRNLIYEFE